MSKRPLNMSIKFYTSHKNLYLPPKKIMATPLVQLNSKIVIL